MRIFPKSSGLEEHKKFLESALSKVPEFWQIFIPNEPKELSAILSREPLTTHEELKPYLTDENLPNWLPTHRYKSWKEVQALYLSLTNTIYIQIPKWEGDHDYYLAIKLLHEYAHAIWETVGDSIYPECREHFRIYYIFGLYADDEELEEITKQLANEYFCKFFAKFYHNPRYTEEKFPKTYAFMQKLEGFAQSLIGNSSPNP